MDFFSWAAICKSQRRVDNLQVCDQGSQHVVKNNRGNAWNGNVPEALPCICTINFRCFHVNPRYILKSCKENHDQVAACPDCNYHQGRHNLTRTVQKPLGLHSKHSKNKIKKVRSCLHITIAILCKHRLQAKGTE